VSKAQELISRPNIALIMRFLHFLSDVVGKQSLLALIDQGFYSLTNFLSGIIIARICSKDQYGLYFLGFSIVLFVLCLQGSLISSPYTVYIARLKGKDHAQFTGSTLIHQLVLSAFAIVVFLVVTVVLSFGIGPQGLAPVVRTLSFVIIFILFREYVRRVCFANLRIKTALFLDLNVALVQIGGLLLLAKFGILSASWAYVPIGVACCLASVSWLLKNKSLIKLKVNKVAIDFANNWSFGRWVFAGNIVLLVSTQIYAWLLSGFHGTIATGVFAACWSVVNTIRPSLAGLTNILGPKAAHALTKGISELRQLVVKFTLVLTGMVTFFCFIILFFGERIIILIYGSKYTGNGTLLLILALSIMVEAVARGVDYSIWAMEQSQANFLVNIFHLVVTVSLGSLLVKTYGPLGAAWALLLSNSMASIIRYIIYIRLINSGTRK